MTRKKSYLLSSWGRQKVAQHKWAIRQFNPEKKLTAANYKEFEARCEGLLCICEGLLCIDDTTKAETLVISARLG